jgi:hypothetical protein
MAHKVLWLVIFTIVSVLGARPTPILAASTAPPVAIGYRSEILPSRQPTNGQFSAPRVLTKTLTLADLGYTRDETLQGISATRSYTFNWPDAWEVRPGNAFTVEFKHSPVLERYSSLAVDWNGVRLGSILLTPENADGGSLTVSIPEDQIDKGYNQLRIVLYMGIHDDRCEDPNNPATWATIQSSSFFELSYDLAVPQANLGDYPAPILDNSGLIENSLTFVIPDDATLAEMNALALISAKLGQLAAWRTLTFQVLNETEFAALSQPGGDVMYVGQADRLGVLRSREFPFVFVDGEQVRLKSEEGVQVDPSSGVLWMQNSSDDPTAVEMVVTGPTDEGLLAAARALASAAVYPRLRGQLGIVLHTPEPSGEDNEFKQVITLEELGYRDETASGTRQQSLNFIISLPMQWQVLTEASLDLHFAHSKLLHQQKSSLTVSVNGSPIGSILLDNDNADDGHSRFIIPARQLKIGENRITVTTSIELIENYEDDQECDEEYIAEAWVVVFSDTRLNLPGGPAMLALNLSDYPFGFIGRPDLSDLAFVAPVSPDLTIANAIVGIAGRIGRAAEGETLAPRVIRPDQTETSVQTPYQILLGAPKENSAIARLNALLPLPFVEGSNDPKPNAQIARILPPNGSTGYVQAALTSDGKPRLVVTGSDSQGVEWAARALTDPALIRDLNGDLAILDADGAITTAYIHKPAAPAPITPSTQSEPSTPRWVAWLAGGLFLVTLVLLLLIAASEFMNRRKAGKSHESPTL